VATTKKLHRTIRLSCAANLSSWHFASVQTHGLNGRYRMHSGQGSEPALNGSVAIDPKQTLQEKDHNSGTNSSNGSAGIL
jgi:hypothetical protein